MPDPDLITLFVRPLNALRVRYMVSGSVAAMLYGEPRLTHDIDVVVFLDDAAIARLPAVFPGPQFYVPPVEVMIVEARRDRRGHFNVIHAPSGLKADFYLSNRDELHAWAIERTRVIPLGGVDVSVAPPEYVILRKLEYHRDGGSEKHLRDIRSMLALSGAQFDRPALLAWVERLALSAQWDEAVAGSA